MVLKKEFHLCSIANQDFLIPIGATVVDVNSMLDLNEVSSFVVKLIRERSYSEEELVDCIYEEYEADKEMIRRDLRSFINKGVELGFIE